MEQIPSLEELLRRLNQSVSSDISAVVQAQAELKTRIQLLEAQLTAESKLIQQRMDSKLESLEGRIDEVHKVVIRGNGRESLTVTVGRLDEKFAQRGLEIQELKADIKDIREVVNEIADEIQLMASKSNSSALASQSAVVPAGDSSSKSSGTSISVLGMQLELWKIVLTGMISVLTLVATAWVNEWSSSPDKPPIEHTDKD